MGWREIIDGAYTERSEDEREFVGAKYEHGASRKDLLALVNELGCALPADLQSLLLESNGFTEVLEVEGRLVENMWTVWPASELPDNNRHRHEETEEPKPPEYLLVFASAGADGILFAYDTRSPESGVVAWFPVEDEIRPLASSLREFLVGWITGKIEV